jgi:hypothetical protein
MVWVRERTIPTERQPLVGEVIANFCGQRVPRGERDGSLLPYSRFFRQEPLLFYQVAPQLYSGGWVDPVSDPLLFFLVVPGIETGTPWICSQELWPLDHRGGQNSSSHRTMQYLSLVNTLTTWTSIITILRTATGNISVYNECVFSLTLRTHTNFRLSMHSTRK